MGICLFKVTIETIKQGVKYVQSQELRHQNDVNDVHDVLLVSLFLTLSIFHTSSSVVIAGFVNVSTRWVVSVNLSKDAFYITYSDIKKRARIDFAVYKIQCTKCVKVYRFCNVFHIFQNALSRCIMLNPLEDIFHSVHA